MDWNAIGNAIWDFCVNNGVKILNAILIFVLGYLLIKIIMKVTKKLLTKTKINKVTQSFGLSVISFALKLILIIAVLNALGIETTGLVALIAAAGLAISLALQNSLANLANGVVIITTQPFEIGDHVSVNNIEGTIKHIHMLTSTIVTFNNEEITLPNSTIINNPIVNYSRLKTRRSVLSFKVAYHADIKLCKQIILDVIHSDGRTFTDPTPYVTVDELGDDYITLKVYFWVDAEDYYSVNNYVREALTNEFKKNNIPRSHKQYEVNIQETPTVAVYEDKALQPRIEKVRKQEKQDFFSKLESKAKEYENKIKKKKTNKKRKQNVNTLEVNHNEENKN